MLDALRDDGYHVETIAAHAARAAAADGATAIGTRVPRDGAWELAVCSRFPVLDRRLIPMGVVPPTRPGLRNALALTVEIDGTPVEVIGLHTSSKVWRLAPLQPPVDAARAGSPRAGRRSSRATSTSGARRSAR